MANDTKAEKADKNTQEPKAVDAVQDSGKSADGEGNAPSQLDLPEGIYGGPATINNPPLANVVDKDKVDKKK